MEKKVKRETTCMENKIGSINGGKYPGMHRHSQTISKMKPKIRIIHIFAPQIIHTDVHNFRQLVQSLTGKPTTARHDCTEVNTKQQATHVSQQSRERLTIKEEEEQEQGFYGDGDGEISSGGYLRGLEGFISEFGDFPFFPNWDASHRHAQEFEDTLPS